MIKHNQQLSFVPETAIRNSMNIDYDTLAAIIMSIRENGRYDGVHDVYDFARALTAEGDLKIFISQDHADRAGFFIDIGYEEREEK